MLRLIVAAALGAATLSACAPPAKDAAITGQFTSSGAQPLPPGAIAHVKISDIKAIDEPPTLLASADVPAPALPLAFSVTVPAEKMASDPALSVSVRIAQGDQVLFISEEKNPVSPGTPITIQLAAVTPVPIPYTCGEDKFSISFTNDLAQVAIGKAPPVSILAAPNAPGAPADLKTYTNGKMTFFRKGVDLSFARGKAAAIPCVISE